MLKINDESVRINHNPVWAYIPNHLPYVYQDGGRM